MTVIHIMADGTVRDSVAGVEVPEENAIYEILGGEEHVHED